MNNYIFCLLLFIPFCNATTDGVKSCQSGGLLPIVSLNDCEHVPCELHAWGTIGLTLTFKAPRFLQQMSAQVNVFVDIINTSISFPLLDQKNVCNGLLNTRCPLMEGEYIEYSLNFRMPWAPPTSVTVNFSINDDYDDSNNKTVVCFGIDAVVV